MPFVLTLIASDKPLSAGHLAGVERFIDQQGLGLTGTPKWLAPHQAADLPICTCLDHDQMAQLWDAFRTDRIDVFCAPSQNRRKKLFLADMDSTIVTSETLDELAVHAGIGEKIADITRRAMNGELNFEDALNERIGLLTDLPEIELQRTLKATKISGGAADIVSVMREKGAKCVLVSGGFTFFTGAIAGQLGFDAHHGNVLEIKNGKLTGRVTLPILNKDSKLSLLNQYVQELGITLKDSLAVGDGANDLPMLEAAGLGIGYRPKPLLRDQLLNCLFYADLTALLYLQGYEKVDIC